MSKKRSLEVDMTVLVMLFVCRKMITTTLEQRTFFVAYVAGMNIDAPAYIDPLSFDMHVLPDNLVYSISS